MKIIDLAEIIVSSGNGGNGAVAFRREKYVSHGGPAGGDGGHGGSVFLLATTELQTLLDFHHQRQYQAPHGEAGRSKNQHGKKGKDLMIKVPVGTLIRDLDRDAAVICDLTEDGQTFCVAKGGKGGRGNTHFAKSTYQAPKYAEPGGKGQTRKLQLELKMIADVGLVGLPNAGKSSLLSVVSAARPKIANYPFTTLKPNLGAIRFPEGDGFLMADIPGLIEGASEGVGLGHDFLRHIERNRLLLHLVDVSEQEPLENYELIQNELKNYPVDLSQKPQLLVLNKIDLLLPEDREALKKTFEEHTQHPVYLMSTATKEGTQELLRVIQQRLSEIPLPEPIQWEEAPPEVEHDPTKEFEIHFADGVYFVESDHLEQMILLSDFSDAKALNRFQKALKGTGVLDALHNKGAQPGDTICIGPLEFEHL